MPEREPKRPIPRWAERERAEDFAWIAENLSGLWMAAKAAYAVHGRGAVVVDTTVRPTGAGHPFGYFSQEQIRQLAGPDEIRMVTEYNASWEVIIVLLKRGERISSYRIGVPGQQPKPNTR
jgi:hypothetical protein